MLKPEAEYGLVCGIDEAGRGPLAGPVCAAAVILPEEYDLPGLNDSKKLSPKAREALYDRILETAVSWGIGWADEREIDEINILQATFRAMGRAFGGLDRTPDTAFVDGNRDPGLPVPARLVVGGDGKYDCIAAASILAKVSRDRLMLEYDRQYPGYGFAKHKGYGTKAHYAALAELGPCPIHRLSFLKGLEK